MGKILVVDDEESIQRLFLQRFRQEVKEGSLEFFFALDGEEALAQLSEKPDVDCVISDINMPKMDGITLLEKIKELYPLTRTIMISAYGDLPNIRSAMNRGAFDFLTKPIDFSDLKLTLKKTLAEVQKLRHSIRLSAENQVLRRYVNPALYQTFDPEAERNAQKVEATVGFIDICGFTRLSEFIEPEVMRSLVNLYFDIIAQETLKYGGAIDKYIGDAAMVIFEGTDQLARAVMMALNVCERLIPYQSQEMSPSQPYPAVSVGLNKGIMISGDFGSQTIKRFDFTVIGDPVNVAARVETLAGPGEIFLPAAWSKELSSKFRLEHQGAFKVYNKKVPLEVIKVISVL
ncbi:MAG: response regulator [Spirochaetales bacterium]|nr:response regulator [Spirochaetales bacterium]